jgi:DNA mismatch repair protein MutL
MFLPSVTSYKERFSDAILASSGEAAFLHQISALSSGFNVTIVIGGPEVYRNHRKDQFVFANGRRIVDFGFNQALEYGTQGAFPNSSHPIGALFIDIDPHLADFNIHPAKKEAKFLCSGEIHHTVTEALRSYFRDILIKNGGSAEVLDQKMLDETPYDDVASWVASRAAAESAALLSKEKDDYSASGKEISYASEFFNNDLQSDKAVHYAGRAFGLFILVEKDDILYAIDQHAAHERLIYERMVSNPIPYQELLVPIPFTTDSAEDDYFLGTEQERLKKLGVIIVKDNNGWRIDALPVLWTLGDKDTVIKILSLRTAGENMADHWAATIACHSAIRDGEYMDDASALSLAKEALALPVRACPHGRPILIEIKKDELFKAVRRI